MDTLFAWGWTEILGRAFEAQAKPGEIPGRIVEEQKGAYKVRTGPKEIQARVTGRLMFQAGEREDFPAVGDWVALRPGDGAAVITGILPRLTKISRRAAGRETQEQIIAANVDTVFVVTAFLGDLNTRRLERYLAAVITGGATPVILINKADAAEGDPGQTLRECQAALPGAVVHGVSARTGQGMEALTPYLTPGCTVALLGSSGVGKSTLINHLLGEDLLDTGRIREDDGRGRHTTTSRRMVRLPSGALLVDTPGMRELGAWDGEEELGRVFSDVKALAVGCRFTDCAHGAETGCAVRAAMEAGTLDAARFANYEKMRKEAAYQERRKGGRAAVDYKRRSKKMVTDYKKIVKRKRDG